jgi:methyl-accepting chemotaxis protein
VYRTDDGYVHMSVSVLKAAGIWDESWDATDGTLFLQHITRLDARHKSDQEQVRVLELHRDALAKDRALQKYTNVSAELKELRQQIKQLQDDAKSAEQLRAADATAARKADAVHASSITLLRNSLDTVTATQETLQREVSQVQSSSTDLARGVDDLRALIRSLSSGAKKTTADLDQLRQQHEALQHSTMHFAGEAHTAISVLDDDLTKLVAAVNANAEQRQPPWTQVADLLDQVQRIQGQMLYAVNDPRRDVWLASIADRIKRTDNMQQDTLLQLGALHKAVEGLEREIRHVPGEVADLYRHQQANANSILTTWVHIQRIMSQLMPDWRATYGLPAVE